MKVAAHLQWLWTFATPDTTVYAVFSFLLDPTHRCGELAG
jgi:hypothetical protein